MTGDRPEDGEQRDINFGRTAVDYERHRPGFPDDFFDRLVERRWIVEPPPALTGTHEIRNSRPPRP